MPKPSLDAHTAPRAARLLNLLPQTQCTRCGEPDCAAYAHAMDAGLAPPNRCPPGGQSGADRLANAMDMAPLPLDPIYGLEQSRHIVWIDEDWCIGCTLCIKACPVDAIIGANKRMHTVLESACTGCDLCLPVCPVDCMHVEDVSGAATGWAAWSEAQAQAARARYDYHRWRTERDARRQSIHLEVQATMKLSDLAAHSQYTEPALLAQKREVVQAALTRARARRAAWTPLPPAPSGTAPDPGTSPAALPPAR